MSTYSLLSINPRASLGRSYRHCRDRGHHLHTVVGASIAPGSRLVKYLATAVVTHLRVPTTVLFNRVSYRSPCRSGYVALTTGNTADTYLTGARILVSRYTTFVDQRLVQLVLLVTFMIWKTWDAALQNGPTAQFAVRR